ncbi:SIR2 family protein [Pseudomonas sp. MRSN 12121]|uniref:SIR2 family protein n=1 Tax=Pseudomonas sp. MRSN 12121 TaxID=1611770 RepID=UPI0009E357FA|nr:SIR2 family protein [Pseudomonas sp. MRSN 12121]
MQLSEAVQHALDGNAVLFVGSGFSFGATSLSGGSPMSGRDFARYLYKEAGVDAEDTDLAMASQFYSQKFGEAKLTQICRDMFTIRHPAVHHNNIVNVPWQRIYTTNYDDLVEKSGAESGRSITALTPSDSPERFLSNGKVCLHINGLITRLGVGDLSATFKLTFESYMTDALEHSSWKAVLCQDLRLARSIIFIGYSMYDLNLAQIVHVEDIKDKTIFIAAPDLSSNSPDALRLPMFGELFPIGVGSFSQIVTDVRKDYLPKKTYQNYFSLEKLKQSAAVAQPMNSDVEKLFLYGDLNSKFLGCTSANSDPRFYLIERSIMAEVKKSVKAGQDILFTSDLGNGKSIALEQAGRELSELGWEVFKVTEDSQVARKEIVQLLSLDAPVALLIDGYIPFLEFIDFVSIRRVGKKVCFLLTSRTHVHEAYLDRLENALHVALVPEFDINQLSKSDSLSLVSMIDTYGLWSEFSSLPDIQRVRLIDSECRGQFHQVLLKLYEAPQIASRIKSLFGEIRPDVKRIVIAIFLVKASGLEMSKSLVNDLLEGSPLARLSNNDKESVRFLWSDNSGYIQLKSSVLAEYYLTSLSDAYEVLSVLTGMFLRAETLEGRNYEFFMRSVMTYSALQKMLPRSGLETAVVSFYEEIQNTKFAKKNPHYWLQYAIARMALEDNGLEHVEAYFKSAYAFAKLKPNYNTYQIDNHFARFTLQKSLLSESADGAFELYLDAKAILLRQTLNEQKHYPFRVAAKVADVVQKYGSQFSLSQKTDLVQFCEVVLERIAKLPPETRSHRHVENCKRMLVATVKELSS